MATGHAGHRRFQASPSSAAAGESSPNGLECPGNCQGGGLVGKRGTLKGANGLMKGCHERPGLAGHTSNFCNPLNRYPSACNGRAGKDGARPRREALGASAEQALTHINSERTPASYRCC